MRISRVPDEYPVLELSSKWMKKAGGPTDQDEDEFWTTLRRPSSFQELPKGAVRTWAKFSITSQRKPHNKGDTLTPYRLPSRNCRKA